MYAIQEEGLLDTYPIPCLDLNATQTSKWGPWRENVLYFVRKNIAPQTLRETVLRRIRLKGRNASDDYQQSRTLVGVVRTGDSWKVYPYEPNTIKALRNIVERDEIKKGASYVDLESDDPLVKKISDFDPGRCFAVKTSPLIFPVKPDAKEYYGTRSSTIALMGKDGAIANAEYILGKMRPEGRVHFDLSNLTEGVMRVQPCGLGSNDHYISNVDAGDHFDGKGWLQGVALTQKNSP